jgi:homoserine kinase
MADREKRGIRLRLPATSANLGPGFDAAGLALSMYLTVEAWPAEESTPPAKERPSGTPEWTIEATGRDAKIVGKVDGNLIVETYKKVIEDVWRGTDSAPEALRLKINNEIPLGMGCGSSAAAICAGVALADHFGALKLSDERIVTAATTREGHPDNVAACWHGGFTVSTMAEKGVKAASFAGHPEWELMLAMQPTALATKEARALLPDAYSRADAVFNVQRAALLTAAFAQGRLDLLKAAMQDRIHQPYRLKACPLLERLLPLAEEAYVAGVALSGAGPSVLVILNEGITPLEKTELLVKAGGGIEWVPVRIAGGVEREVLQAT